MKTYVLTLSKTFPAWHPRKGEPTDFKEKFLNGQKGTGGSRKIHTIRANYPLWKKRIEEVREGKAVISIRQWSGRPYASKQVIIETLSVLDDVGIQKLEYVSGNLMGHVHLDGVLVLSDLNPELAKRDGLSLEDWLAWFKNYDTRQPLAIIHFTKFRY